MFGSEDKSQPQLQQVGANGIRINVAVMGSGPPVILLHGWPHTWQVWQDVMPMLASDHKVVAPDLRGLGATSRPEDGYDLHTLADDVIGLQDALNIDQAAIVGLDLGVQIAAMTALRHPTRVTRLAVMEGLLAGLPGAEAFLDKGPPWWFGFHLVPNLAETVLEGHEADYIDFFLRAGTKDQKGVPPAVRDAFVAAYTGRAALRGGFAHYRGFPEAARQLADLVRTTRLTVPTLAISGGAVGDAIHDQLKPIAQDLTRVVVAGCGHIIPLEQPEQLADILRGFLHGGL